MNLRMDSCLFDVLHYPADDNAFAVADCVNV